MSLGRKLGTTLAIASACLLSAPSPTRLVSYFPRCTRSTVFSRFHIQPTFCSPNHHHRFYLHPCLRFQFAFHPFSSFYLSLSLSFLSSSFFYFLWTVGWPAGEFVTGTCTRKMDPGILVSNPRPFIPQILLLPCLGDDGGNGERKQGRNVGAGRCL